MPDIVVGRNAVRQLLVSEKKVHRILIYKNCRQDEKIQEIIELAGQERIPLMYVDNKEIERIYDGANHQGILAYVPAFQYAEIEDILEYAKERNEQPFILILDELEDPYNFGSLARTSVAAGVHGIIIPQKKQVEITPTVVKVSTGAVHNILIAKVNNIVQAVEKLKKEGVWVIGTHQNAKDSYTNLKYDFPLAFIIGNEGRGIGRLLKEKCDYFVKIPINTDKIDSLNASVAGALVIFKIREKRDGC